MKLDPSKDVKNLLHDIEIPEGNESQEKSVPSENKSTASEENKTVEGDELTSKQENPASNDSSDNQKKEETEVEAILHPNEDQSQQSDNHVSQVEKSSEETPTENIINDQNSENVQ